MTNYLPLSFKRLLRWRQPDEEDDWRNKAFDGLVKRLKKDPETFRVLDVVLSQAVEDTPCIPLPRSQDGRLQVSGKKMLPHVMYCRVFRWADLQSQHELKSVPRCQYSSDNRSSKVCVNPYHYVRVEHSLYPPVVVPRDGPEYSNASPPSQSPLSPSSAYSQQRSPNFFQAASPSQMPNSAQGFLCAPQQSNNFAYQIQANPCYSGFAESPPPSYDCRNAVVPMDECASPSGYTNNVQDAWCRIQYSELTKIVGEPFWSSAPKIFIDGYTYPVQYDKRRFSLGNFSNMNRNSTITKVRENIRNGIALEEVDGQIFVDNMSEIPIFFHSKTCNVENQFNQHAVIKIGQRKRHKIFEPKVFEGLVQEATQSENAYDRLYSLTEHCVIKLSFGKGWGSIYQRQDVTSTPCWIEISSLKHLELLSAYLASAGRPSTNITSTS